MNIIYSQAVVKCQINGIPNQPRTGAHLLVNPAGRDEKTAHRFVPGKKGGVNHGGNADRHHRYTERHGIELLTVVPNAGTGGDPAAADLHAAAETIRIGSGQGVHRDHAAGKKRAAQRADLQRTLHAGGAEYTSAADSGGSKGVKERRLPGLEVPRNQNTFRTERAERIRRDIGIAESRHKKGPLLSLRKTAPDQSGKRSDRIGKSFLAAARNAGKFHRIITSKRFSKRLRSLLIKYFHRHDGKAQNFFFPRAYTGESGCGLRRGAPKAVCLGSKVGSDRIYHLLPPQLKE